MPRKRRARISTPGDVGAPNRELDEKKTGQRAGTPAGLIRNPVKPPPMRPVKR